MHVCGLEAGEAASVAQQSCFSLLHTARAAACMTVQQRTRPHHTWCSCSILLSCNKCTAALSVHSSALTLLLSACGCLLPQGCQHTLFQRPIILSFSHLGIDQMKRTHSKPNTYMDKCSCCRRGASTPVTIRLSQHSDTNSRPALDITYTDTQSSAMGLSQTTTTTKSKTQPSPDRKPHHPAASPKPKRSPHVSPRPLRSPHAWRSPKP